MRSTARPVLLSATCIVFLLACGRAEEGAETRGGAATGQTASPAQQEADVRRGGAGETGTATVYAGTLEGGRTAGGETFSHDEMMAAHRTLPFGTQVRVINVANDRSATVRITDRIPPGSGAIIDLSRRAARELGIGEQGQAQVRVEVID